MPDEGSTGNGNSGDNPGTPDPKSDAKELATLKTAEAVREAKATFDAAQKAIVDAKVKADAKKSSKDNITIPVSDFKDMQTRMMTLEKEATDAKDAAELSTRNNLFSSLEQLDPKLAKLNEKSTSAVLEIVLSTAREMKTGFPSIKKDGEAPEGATAGNHSESHYDFVEGKFVYT